MNHQEIYTYAVFVIFAILAYVTKFKTLRSDTIANGEPWILWDAIYDSIVEFVVAIVIITGVLLGVEITGVTPPEGIIGFGGAMLAGAGLPTTVTKFVMPLFGGGNKARKNLQEKAAIKTAELERLKNNL